MRLKVTISVCNTKMIRMHQQCNPECLRKLSSRVLIHRQSYFACGGRKTHPHPVLREKEGVGEKWERERADKQMQKHGKRKPTDIMGPQTLTPALSVCQGSMHSCLPPGASLLQPIPDHTTDSPGQKTQPASDLNSQGRLGLSGGPTVRNTFSLQRKAVCTKKRKQH